MRILKQVSTLGIGALLIYTLGCSQQKTQSSVTQSEPIEQSNLISVAQVIEGELTKVDTMVKTLSVRLSQGQEMELRYDDQTQISGAEGGVEGLSTQNGTPVRVRFDSVTKTATKIEVRRRQQR